MRWWDEQVVPRVVDLALRGAEIDALRTETCEGLAGTVLEIGFGSGRNVPFYPASVTDVMVVEPSDVAWSAAASRVEGGTAVVRRVGLDAAVIDLADDSVDAVLSTFSLCTIPGVESALAQVGRVLRPGGVFHFAEHGRSPDPAVQRWQRRMDGVHARVVGGCHIDRPIVELIEDAGLQVTRTRSLSAGRPKSTGYITLGRAVAA